MTEEPFKCLSGKEKSVEVLRWLAFIPSGFFAAVIAGVLTNLGANFFLRITWIAWSTSGAFSAAAFILVGLKVAPTCNRTAKWSLIIPSLLFGVISGLGSLLGDDPVSVLCGVAMIAVSIGFMGMKPEGILEEKLSDEVSS
jgi:hypothetical protein